MLKRFLPRSLIGQIALLMAIALLFAQAINFSLVFSERQRATRAQVEGPAISRYVSFAQRLVALPEDQRSAHLPDGRRLRFTLDSESLLDAEANEERIAERLRESAIEAGLVLGDVRGAVAGEVTSTRPHDHGRQLQIFLLSARLQGDIWLNGRMLIPRPNPWVAVRAAASTLLIYLIVLGAMVWMARRLARPLRDLALAAERFEGRGEAPRVEPRGPEDVKRAILAFNAMSGRVGAMLEEKDRMLGAIGHDLRTPLASLRIRAESIEPEEERQRTIATIEEMAAMLDDTLALARSGRASEPPRVVDLTALVDAVVEEFHAMGQDVVMTSGARHPARIQPNLLRPALRNLIENGIKYGGSVRVSVQQRDCRIEIRIEDDGPGIKEAELPKVQEAFYRVENSRSRETGGSGLGLTLARAAVLAHNGSLELANRPEGGLEARILLPGGI